MGLWNRTVGRALRAGEGRTLRRLSAFADQVELLAADTAALSNAQLRGKTVEFRDRLASGQDTTATIAAESFAVVREAATRTLGQRHYHCQLMGGAALLDGSVAEMGTGEGKTLVATLAAYTAALEGQGVHVVTVNDYLAARDAEWMGRIYRFLDLSVGVLTADTTDRAAAYAADITYGTNNEFGFDYLRDNMAVSVDELTQRGHHFAIVDEVDSILIDEARTPLIISGPTDDDPGRYATFAALAATLTRDEDYVVDDAKRTIAVTGSGAAAAEEWLGVDALYTPEHTAFVGLLNNAVKAKELFDRDHDYVVLDGSVLIVDEHTGRVLDGRRYSQGLHQAIEAKEKVEVQSEYQTLATITLQNYFRLYRTLSGMTGTASTEAAELYATYGLNVVPIPPNRPSQRVDHADVVFASGDAKLAAIADEVAARHNAGQPVLVGTASVEASERVSAALRRAGVTHQVLNAKNHAAEAAIIAEAGAPAAVTVATNMAGRGTDIHLGGSAQARASARLAAEGLSPVDDADAYNAAWPAAFADAETQVAAAATAVREAGGLYVIGTERHESRRIDNQLRGRTARQGDPGETMFFLAMDDELMSRFNSGAVASVLNRAGMQGDTPLAGSLVSRAVAGAQRAVEAQNADTRRNVLKYDEVLNAQRSAVYGERRAILEGADVSTHLRDQVRRSVRAVVEAHTGAGYPEEWDVDALAALLAEQFPGIVPDTVTGDGPASSPVTVDVTSRGAAAELADAWEQAALAAYDARRDQIGAEQFDRMASAVLLDVIDRRWRAHLHEMDYLKSAIGLRAMAQSDPLVEYKREGFDMFAELADDVAAEVSELLFVATPAAEVTPAPAPAALQLSGPAEDGTETVTFPLPPAAGAPDPFPGTSRNAPCPCGSGRKYKRCHADPNRQ